MTPCDVLDMFRRPTQVSRDGDLFSFPACSFVSLDIQGPGGVGVDFFSELGVLGRGGANRSGRDVEVGGAVVNVAVVAFERGDELTDQQPGSDEVWFAATGRAAAELDERVALGSRGVRQHGSRSNHGGVCRSDRGRLPGSQ